MSAESAEKLKEEGNKLFAEAQYIPAIEKYTKAIEEAPADASSLLAVLYTNRAFAQFRLESFGLVLADTGAALAHNASYAKAHYRRAAAHIVLAKWAEAKSDLQQAFAEAISVDNEKQSAFDNLDTSSIVVGADYDGPHLEDGKVTLEFVTKLIQHFKDQKLLHRRYVFELLRQCLALFRAQPTLVRVPAGARLTVCGDVHGQYYDLLSLFDTNGLPSDSNRYLFNGDFVDRGSFSCEVVLTMFAFKLLYPDSFFMARGNHETRNMNKVYGFDGETRYKYTAASVDMFAEVFCALPLAHVLGDKVLVVHGGLFSRDGVKLADIEKIDRFREPPESGLMSELLWSDPQSAPGRGPSKRGVGLSFGPDVTERFLNDNGLTLIVRSHEVKEQGYLVEHDGRLITVFSAPNYCDQAGNLGAYIHFGPDWVPECHSFPAVPHPNVAPMAYASPIWGF